MKAMCGLEEENVLDWSQEKIYGKHKLKWKRKRWEEKIKGMSEIESQEHRCIMGDPSHLKHISLQHVNKTGAGWDWLGKHFNPFILSDSIGVSENFGRLHGINTSMPLPLGLVNDFRKSAIGSPESTFNSADRRRVNYKHYSIKCIIMYQCIINTS